MVRGLLAKQGDLTARETGNITQFAIAIVDAIGDLQNGVNQGAVQLHGLQKTVETTTTAVTALTHQVYQINQDTVTAVQGAVAEAVTVIDRHSAARHATNMVELQAMLSQSIQAAMGANAAKPGQPKTADHVEGMDEDEPTADPQGSANDGDAEADTRGRRSGPRRNGRGSASRSRSRSPTGGSERSRPGPDSDTGRERGRPQRSHPYRNPLNKDPKNTAPPKKGKKATTRVYSEGAANESDQGDDAQGGDRPNWPTDPFGTRYGSNANDTDGADDPGSDLEDPGDNTLVDAAAPDVGENKTATNTNPIDLQHAGGATPEND
jgi:hypothetical protein